MSEIILYRDSAADGALAAELFRPVLSSKEKSKVVISSGGFIFKPGVILSTMDARSFLPDTVRSALTQLRKFYHIASDIHVGMMLKQNPKLAEVLQDAIQQLPKYFGENPVVELTVLDDPESSMQEFFAFVSFSGTAEAAHEAMNKFDDEWFLDRYGDLGGILNFDVKFA